MPRFIDASVRSSRNPRTDRTARATRTMRMARTLECRQRERQRHNPVLPQIKTFVRRNRKLADEIGDEDHPDRRQRRRETACQVDDDQDEPDDAQHGHHRFEQTNHVHEQTPAFTRHRARRVASGRPPVSDIRA